jgi:mono/diheme cytochrome c family protein
MFTKLNVLLVVGIVACLGFSFFLRRDFSQPNYELIPERQMARSPAFGTYAPNPNFADGMTLRRPVPGTIFQGWKAFPYGPEQHEAKRAGEELKNPLSIHDASNRQLGAALYASYCQLCHGPTGNGDGAVSKRGFPLPLSFLKPQALDLKDGEMFHILTLGKGNMPGHALQLSDTERWAVVLHIRVLQNKYTEVPKVSLAYTMQIYKENCFACHGEDGAGTVYRAKKPYLPDFTSMAWQLSKTNLEITNRIEYGDQPDMPAFRYKLTRENILALAIYIRTFARKDISSSPAAPAPPPSTAGLKPIQIYRAFCLACHNVDGKSAIVRPNWPDVPDFALASWPSKSNAELSKAILNGGKVMPSMKDKLTPETADAMVKFLREYFNHDKKVIPPESQELPKIPEKDKEPVPEKDKDKKPKPKETMPTEPSPEMQKRLWAAGIIFRDYCIACHGPDGTGVPAMRVTLTTLPDFTKRSFHEQHSDPQLLVSILDGKGTAMPSNRGRITEAQAWDLVAFIRAFGPKGSIAAPGPASDFQVQIDELQRQWQAYEKELKALQKPPSK